MAYEKESESDDEEKALVIDISQKKQKMVATRSGRTKDDEYINKVDTDKTSPELAIMKVRKRIFDNEVNDNDEEKDDDEDSDSCGSWMNEMRKKDNQIAALKRRSRH